MRTAVQNQKDIHYGHMAFLFVFIASLLFLWGCTTVRFWETKPVTVAEIIKMSKDKVPADEIIRKMRESGTVYRLKASQLADLKEKGVPDAVINYMQHTYIKAVRRNQALADWNYWTMGPDMYWYGGGPYGWDNDWY